jgi:hypothetical protein
MTTKRSSGWLDSAPPAVLLVVAIIFEVMAHSFPPASAQVPILIGWAMIVLTAVDLLSRMNNQIGRKLTLWLSPAALTDKAERAEKPENEPKRWRQITAICGICAFSLALVYVGVAASVPVFAVIAIRWGGRFSWITSILGAAATTALIWLLFAVLLRMQLFPGLLFGGS